MNVIGAVPSLFRSVFSGDGRLHRLPPGAIHIASLHVLRVQFSFGLQPIRRVIAVPFTGFFPNLMGPLRDVFVTDRRS